MGGGGGGGVRREGRGKEVREEQSYSDKNTVKLLIIEEMQLP